MEWDREAWNFFEEILPPEITVQIFSNFSPEDLVYVSLVCKTWSAYFDTKDIWKKIYVYRYGEVSELVKEQQKFRWKRVFFRMHNLHIWKREMNKKGLGVTSTFQLICATDPSLLCITRSGRYFTNGKVNVDIKMAGKLVAAKRNPVMLQDVSIYNTGSVQMVFNTKPLKDDRVQVMLNDTGETKQGLPWTIYTTPVDKGRYVYRVFTSFHEVHRREVFVLWDTDKFAANEDYAAMRKITLMMPHNHIKNLTFNDKFAVATYGNLPRDVEYLVIDLHRNCQHNMHFKKLRDGTYIPGSEQELCPEAKCTIIERGTVKSHIHQVFASQAVPEKIVLFCRPREPDDKLFEPLEVVVWTHGKERRSTTIPADLDRKKVTDLSEHVTTVNGVQHHWVSFVIQSDYANTPSLHVIDINTLRHRTFNGGAQCRWVPKKNKIVVAQGNAVVVYDLTQPDWQTKIVQSSPVAAIALNSTGNIAFVADGAGVHIYLLETAYLVATIPRGALSVVGPIRALDVGVDQVLIINGSAFMRMQVKCDL